MNAPYSVQLYRQLGCAMHGDRKMASKLLDLAYGRRGQRRHALLREFEDAVGHRAASALLAEFTPQDGVKRTRPVLYPPVPPAFLRQAELVASGRSGHSRSWRRLYRELLGRIPVLRRVLPDGKHAPAKTVTLAAPPTALRRLPLIQPADLEGLPSTPAAPRSGGAGQRGSSAK